MTRIDTRDARPLPAQDDAGPPSVRGARRFDYAALLAARRTVVRPVSDAPPASRQPDDPVESGDATAPSDSYPLMSNERDAPSHDREPTSAELAECRAIAARISHAAAPIAAVTLQEQRDHLGLLGVLSREIAAFCGDAAVAAGGPWEAHVVLNDRILPATELHVSLSHFDLQLRFDAQDRDARQLLLGHSMVLERELDAMLRAWGQPKTVRITVW
ncbi:type III secretion protein HpaP [Burkholderia lata]|uniref:Type III secretion protein HpaP n=1 Tax=Burkholderia lata (strain ATCC 17760 / DSM 23089 / LMG 22485 / NCIMB 9086 / R18194 / 383) TaxID=482957 RepID=A0A6P2SZV6_BURL3|nr:type III secretion system protein SctP [Burkholderia lata]VWC56517.1 type III secretion protein HpaP [Burkholderia lata]